MLLGVYKKLYQCYQGYTTIFINDIMGVQQPLPILSTMYNNLISVDQFDILKSGYTVLSQQGNKALNEGEYNASFLDISK